MIPEPVQSQPHYLGILQDYERCPNGAVSSPSDFLINQQTGEIYDQTADTRLRRYIRQSAARRLLKENRVAWCLRRVKDKQLPAILKSKKTSKCHYGGLISCGKPWECPVCASKIAQRRRNEASLALDQFRADGGKLLFNTFTFSHSNLDDLPGLLTKQDKARVMMCRDWGYRQITESHGVIGKIRALEVTYGANGWHPHIHEIWFLRTEYKAAATAEIYTKLYDIWVKCCLRHGLGEPSRERGIDVRDGSYASDYISKWGLEDEITKANLKEGKFKTSRAPFQLLDDFIIGDQASGDLFIEYSKATARRKQLVWSRGLKGMFDLEEKTDEQIADEMEEKADYLGRFSMDEWALILNNRNFRTDHRAILLAHAEHGGWNAVQAYMEHLRGGVL
jgi:hypothetical protein